MDNPQHPQEEFKEIKEPTANLPVDSRARSQERDFVTSASRKRREEGAKHWGFVVLIWVIVGCVAIAFIFKVWHLLAPASLCWLSDKNMIDINSFLTTGVLSGGVGAFFTSRIKGTTPS